MSLPCGSDEEDDAALLAPCFTTPSKAICNDGACNGEPYAKGTEANSDADVEKEFDESTGKKSNHSGRHSYRVIKEWPTGQHALLEDAEIEHEIYTKMKRIMHASNLKKSPRHKAKETDIHLWKQYSKEYHNKRSDKWTRPFRCPMQMSSAGETNHLARLQAARVQRYA